MPSLKDLTGMVFGRLTVVRRVENSARGEVRWLCRCACESGNETVVVSGSLVAGRTLSCGCFKRETSAVNCAAMAVKSNTKHGQARKGAESLAYRSWHAMFARCTSPKCKDWKNYGGKGVTICNRWNIKAGGSFENFLADLGDRPPRTSLGRFGDVGNYEPGNVKWMTYKEQGVEMRKKQAMLKSGLALPVSPLTQAA